MNDRPVAKVLRAEARTWAAVAVIVVIWWMVT